MKQSNLSFSEGFLGIQSQVARAKGKEMRAFDWDKAASIIKENFSVHKDLKAEAGLQGDWAYTGGFIFSDGKPTNEDYTYLSSNWATPTLILSWEGEEQMEIECHCTENERFHSESKWDENSLAILGIGL